MADPADLGNEDADRWLNSCLSAHKSEASKTSSQDIEQKLCDGCEFITKSSYGKSCDGWVDCLADFDRVEKANKRNGRI